MKRLLAMLLTAVMLMSIAACGDDSTQTATDPTRISTSAPTEGQTDPTQLDTSAPTQGQTDPTQMNTSVPTEGLTDPTQAPTEKQTDPTRKPTVMPTQPETVPTEATTEPTKMTAASTVPTQAPTVKPTAAPTQKPTAAPTVKPTTAPTQKPTSAPTQQPAVTPTHHEHVFTKTVIPATCTLGGYTNYTCACGRSYNGDMTPVKGHGTTRTETEEATYAEYGCVREICIDCNTVVKETAIPKLEHTCNMKRINCRELMDNAVGWYTVTYRTYNECTIMACTKCGQADISTLELVYSSERNSAKIVELINEERRRVFGTDEYDVVVATHHSAAEWGAEYISTDFQHVTPFWNNIYRGGLMGDLTGRVFEAWMNSPPHYALLIHKDVKYVSLGMYVDAELGLYSMLIMWDKDELYLNNPNYTWDPKP